MSLIQEKELSITEVSLSSVTEQYLSHLETVEERQPEQLADFLLIATKLLLIKSKALLPELLPEEESESDLAEQLRVYKMFVEAAKNVNRLWNTQGFSYERIEALQRPKTYEAPKHFDIDAIAQAMKRLITRLEAPKVLPKSTLYSVVSVKQKMKEIRNLLLKKRNFNFFAILKNPYNRSEAIASFLAVLELLKQKKVSAAQESLFGDIIVSKVKLT